MFKIDENDLRIIDLLKNDAKSSTYKIAKKTLIPVTTVHNRIKKLEKIGIIKGYTVVLDKQKLGYSVLAYVLIKGDLAYLRTKKTSPLEAVEMIRKKEGVEEVHSVTGSYDLIVKIRVKNMEELNNLMIHKIREVPGVLSTETIVVLKEH